MGVTPGHKIRAQLQQFSHFVNSLYSSMLRSLQRKEQQLGSSAAKLDGLSPLATLQRGFAIATRSKDNQVLVRSSDVKLGEKIHVQLFEGELECKVENISNQKDLGK